MASSADRLHPDNAHFVAQRFGEAFAYAAAGAAPALARNALITPAEFVSGLMTAHVKGLASAIKSATQLGPTSESLLTEAIDQLRHELSQDGGR